ncbi:deoxyribonuclease V [Aestuariivirga litoralis]|uniref:deoxyribonuclease V n=1 Tax=Aestuariivirga litoralis TaxID=2650924 RepID=UPI0018C7B4CF|nr:deoxyribonuclease V [Aestuariivirga litoralis]MBG1232664.1 deoxyribonuclease V [Aestuariivirga litoralis]
MLSLPEFLTPANAAEAHQIQRELRAKLRVGDDFSAPNLIAGIDVGYDVQRGLAHASIVTMTVDDLKPIEQVQAFVPEDFPYIPGLLAFREIPAILAALAELKSLPDLLMVDGQGIAHPRRMGIAAHLGVILDHPAIGVGKSRLTGSFEMPGPAKGDSSPLMAGNEQIGVVLRSRDNVNPLFISPGHRVSMATALEITQRCLLRHRLPEPTRLADKLSKVKQAEKLLF